MFTSLSHDLVTSLENIYINRKKLSKINLRGEAAVLLYLLQCQKEGFITPGMLSEALNISTARVAASLNSLEKKALIVRVINKKDRRQIIITLTNNGQKQAKELKELQIKHLSFLLKELGEKDAFEVIRIAKRIEKIFEKTKKESKEE